MADQVVSGKPTASHAGTNTYGWQIDGAEQWYCIPMKGDGAVAQAVKVEFAKAHGATVTFLADPDTTVKFHDGTEGWKAHDID